MEGQINENAVWQDSNETKGRQDKGRQEWKVRTGSYSVEVHVRLDGVSPASDLGLNHGATKIKGGSNKNTKAHEFLQVLRSLAPGILRPSGVSDIQVVLVEPFGVVLKLLTVHLLSDCHGPNIGAETCKVAILIFRPGKKLSYHCAVIRDDFTTSGGSGGVGAGSGRAAVLGRR